MRTSLLGLRLEGKEYVLKPEPHDSFASTSLVARSPPDLQRISRRSFSAHEDTGPSLRKFIACWLIIDPERRKLNKDHNHDYEQIQMCFDIATGMMDKVIVSSTRPVKHGGHGVEVLLKTSEAMRREVEYVTSP